MVRTKVGLYVLLLLCVVQVYIIHQHTKGEIVKQKEWQSFINKGARNTAQHGKILCRRQNILASKLDEPLIDCDLLYNLEFPSLQALTIAVD